MTTNGIGTRPLPDGWTWTDGQSLFRWASGKNLPQKNMQPGPIPVFGGNGIGGFHNETLVTHPTLVIGRVGAYCGNVHITKGNSWITDNAIYAQEISDSISLKFAQIAFQLAKLNEQAAGSGQPFVNQRMLNEVEFALPPLVEQERIVAEIEKQFTRLDQAVVSLRRLQTNLSRYKASVLKSACEGRLVPQDPTDEPASELLQRILSERRAQWQTTHPGKKYEEPVGITQLDNLPDLPEIPESWTWVALGELAWSVKDGPHYSPKYVDEGVPFISGGNVRPQGIDFEKAKYITRELHEELSKRCKPERGDILYTKGGTTGIARVNTYDREFNVWVHVAVVKLVQSIEPFYIQHALNSHFCYGQSQKYTHGVGNQDLGLTRMIKIVLALPPLAEQHRIVAEVEQQLSVITATEQAIITNLARANRLRQSILHRAFTGQLVPQDA